MRLVQGRVCPSSVIGNVVGAAGYADRVKTRYLLLVSLAVALIILGASAVWFLMAVK